MSFIILDIETTGFSVDKNEITEIAAIKVNDNLEIIDKLEFLIDINGQVPYFITKLTGITKRMLDELGIPPFIALNALSEFCGNLSVYAHNASFDKRFIREWLRRHEVEYAETDWIDTISIFKKAFPGRSTYRLASLMEDYGLGVEEHRGLSDSINTLKLLKIAKCS